MNIYNSSTQILNVVINYPAMEDMAPVAGKLKPPAINRMTMNNKGLKQTSSQEARIAIQWNVQIQIKKYHHQKRGNLPLKHLLCIQLIHLRLQLQVQAVRSAC